jgi:acyl transferase domain-containing protein/NAD(P)H-dependent flavin oxidoreductase YrpB (nitropropane dioxygenase family)/NAD(P)-dependent dehydrogenase (short-subunit alcohol dehydrogenase family)
MPWSIPRVMALSPSGLGHPSLVVAAGRSGGLGILDFGLVDDWKLVAESSRQAAEYLGHDRAFGLRLSAEAIVDFERFALPENGRVIIVTEPAELDWNHVIALANSLGRMVVAEVTSRDSARAATRAGALALVLAGHEAAGRGSDESSFVLLQGVLAQDGPPLWVRGGVGPRVAAACVAVGAAGVVLDGAVWLARESPLKGTARERLEHFDGSETVVLGRATGWPVRVHASPGSAAIARLRAAEGLSLDAWREAVRSEVGWQVDQAWPVGQDAAHASVLAHRFVTVGGIIQAVERAIDEAATVACAHHPFAEGAALARSHGTRYPIVQGPMTRVSDTVAFAQAVADGGGLPFLALALMRGPEVRALLGEAKDQLAGRSWGVGILGFVPPELRHEQVAAIREARPPFALIAGGRPDQARELEREGIPTYLHVPSPGLLRQYVLKEGARRFVLEGRECGGHVGPRSSFVLWEQAVDVVCEAIEQGVAADEIHILFAGGIHDARSAALVATLAAPLAECGVRIGVLVGTAYVFTNEAVSTGAIVAGFQNEAVHCDRTVLLETGPGHEVRVCPTPFTEAFARERERLLAEGQPGDQVRAELEDMNVGRLRVAAKGVDRSQGRGSPLVEVDPDDQKERGLYMVGEVAALRDRVTTIAELHRDICEGSIELLRRSAAEAAESALREVRPQPADIAIVGMSAIFPGAPDVRTFWENTLQGVDTITEVPLDRWDWRLYYDPDPKAPDKITSKWGGFLPEVAFDPLRYGMPPTSLPSIEPMHLLTLEVVRAALDDAGYRERSFPRERTSVVLGAGGGAAQLAMGYAFRSYLPLIDTVVPGGGRDALARCGAALPEWTEDSFPGILLNVAAGRVANRFDLGGANYTVDAACGSSLAAATLAVRELESGAADMVILGGADTVQNPFTYLAFSKTHAFSPRGRCRPFDASADGIVISEGVAALVLKRLADAERDGDRIYAVFKGLGAASDGRAKGLTAPHEEGQIRALRRAYAKAGFSPDTVGYVEAHGTGTAAGDLAEVGALNEVFGAAGTERGACALGSVKSSIGHTKCAAGLAGLINASLALYHKVLPPTIGVVTPNPRANLGESPFHISTTTRPWIQGGARHPRRAGVSAFGFGGTNFHAVLEAYDRDPLDSPAPLRDWPAELFVWRAPDRDQLAADLDRLQRTLAAGSRPALRDLAHTINVAADSARSLSDGPILAIVATTLDDLETKLSRARQAIESDQATLNDPRGLYFAERPAFRGATVAFVFPGQGSQYAGMLGDVVLAFSEVRQGFEQVDDVLRARNRRAIGPLVFPPPVFSEEERKAQQTALCPPDVAQPSVGAACLGLLRLLSAFGLEPDMVAGHSYGELVALHGAGSLTSEALIELSEARGRLLLEAAGDTPGAMAALAAGPAQVNALLDGLPGVFAVNWNGPSQTVISGLNSSVEQVVDRARSLGLRAQALPVVCAFHSPLVSSARDPLARLVSSLHPSEPRKPIYSNATAAPYPNGAEAIATQLGEHLAQPVRFAEMIEAMHAAGARVFVEVGPGGVVSALTASILAGKPHLAVACDHPGQPGVPSLLQALGRLAVAGVPVRLERLSAGRSAQKLDGLNFEYDCRQETASASLWLVNGARARPAHGADVAPFGRGPALPAPSSEAAMGKPVAQSTLRPIAHQNGQPKANEPPITARVPAPARSIAAGTDRVVEAFQNNMQRFLELQRATMLEYLAARGASPLPSGLVHKPSPPDHLAPVELESSGPRASSVPRESHAERNGHQEGSPSAPSLNGATATGPFVNGVAHHHAVADHLSRDDLSSRLLRIVQDRTGYPAEMLGLDLDLEADLGIDSIKRVEILGSLRDSLPAQAIGSDSETMDQLSRARTLGAIVDRIGRNLADGPRVIGREAISVPIGSAAASVPEQANGLTNHVLARNSSVVGELSHAKAGAEVSPHAVRRLLLERVEAPLRGPSAGMLPGGLVLVTDDGRGIARAVAADLRALGHPVVRVRHGLPLGEVEGVNLTSAAAVSAFLDRLRSQGPLAGIVHALPLSERLPVGLEAEAWRARMSTDVRGLFLLARAAAEDLARAADRGGACLIAATAMGGSSASGGDPPPDFFAGHGGLAGLVKTLAREWPGVRTRSVDLDPDADLEVIAAHLVQEVLAGDRHSEVGYLDGRRLVLRHVEAPLEQRPGSEADIALAPGEPLLVTGGARGITAAVVADLAQRWRPTLLLIGTSPLPPDVEDPATAGRVAMADLKAVLMERLRSEGLSGGPLEIERRYQALRREREIRSNLRSFREAGARVEYAQVDVRDESALGRTLSTWEQQFGPPVGLIHGAGVIQDKLICDKTPESFDHVVGTKLSGALALARLVRPEALRFAAFFSSVAGRFGNRGQGDYAAASEALNKLAVWLDRRWSCRVVSLLWGPWSSIGMVSDLEAHLGRRGLGMIPPDIGCSRLAEELCFGRKGDVEVIVTGDLGPLAEPIERIAEGVLR